MVFDTNAWKQVREHYPLCRPDIARLQTDIVSSAEVGLAIVMWGVRLQEIADDMDYDNRMRKIAIERDSVHCLAV